MIAKRSRRVTGQRFYVSIVGANGERMFTSEMLKDRDYAVELGQRFAKLLKGGFINAT